MIIINDENDHIKILKIHFQKFNNNKFKQQISSDFIITLKLWTYMIFFKSGIFTVTQALVHHRIPAWKQYVS